MPDTRVTEERLRAWLDANQVQRERLCAQLLPLLGSYSQVEPRRPKGGPDGARDLQAIHNADLQVWGGFGFRNAVKDDVADKRWACKKFKDDLQTALNENAALKGFVFFTNVDLTPGEQDKLKNHAKGKGIGHVDIFNRERMRLVLDSIEGWGYRLQFLEIEMTREEQLAFIERYGSRLESLLEKQRQELNDQQWQIENKLKRIEFMHDCSKPVVEAMVEINLNRAYTAGELGQFRILLQISSFILDPQGAETKLLFASQDAYRYSPDRTLLSFSATNRVWSQNPDETIVNSGIDLVPMSLPMMPNGSTDATTRSLGSFATVRLLKSGFRTLGTFDRATIRVYLTRSLFQKISSVAFVVNDYLVVKASTELLIMPGGNLTRFHQPTWHEDLSETEKENWGQLQIKDPSVDDVPYSFDFNESIDRGRKLQRPTFIINFNEYTPLRIGRIVPILPDIGAVQSSY